MTLGSLFAKRGKTLEQGGNKLIVGAGGVFCGAFKGSLGLHMVGLVV
jgi:hypothetical protein